MKSNLAQEAPIPQGEMVHFPKKERQVMSKKEEGYTRMPNLLVDDQIMAQLSDKAFKCLMLIVRHTVGFDRTSHTIAITQFQKFCGIKKEETVTKVIRELEQYKLITVDRKKGYLNTYTPTINQHHEMGVPPSNGSTPMQGGGSATIEQGYTTPIKGGTNKETLKENIKEIHTQENSPEILDDSWKPNQNTLIQILRTTKHSQRAEEILGMENYKFHLGNFNAHWENKIDLTENQKNRKFIAWLIQEFEKQLVKAERESKFQTDRNTSAKQKNQISRNVNDAWKDIPVFQGKVEQVELPEGFE